MNKGTERVRGTKVWTERQRKNDREREIKIENER